MPAKISLDVARTMIKRAARPRPKRTIPSPMIGKNSSARPPNVTQNVIKIDAIKQGMPINTIPSPMLSPWGNASDNEKLQFAVPGDQQSDLVLTLLVYVTLMAIRLRPLLAVYSMSEPS